MKRKSQVILSTGLAAAVVVVSPVLGVQAEAKGSQKEQSATLPRELAQTALIKASDSVRHAELVADVTGLETITLLSKGVDGNAFDWVDWVSLKFINAKGKAIEVGEESVLKASQGWGTLHYNANVEGKPLSLSGKVFAKGIGTHADSSIQLKVPKGAVKFVAIAGLDDQAVKDGGPDKASAQFSVINDQAPWLPGAEAEVVSLDHFSIPEDSELEVTLWAKSPQLFNPTNMAIDHKGRIWVSEGVNYREKKDRRPQGDRIVVLEDTDGDGVADKSHTFVEDPELAAPLGVAVFENKVIVSQSPNLIVYTDVNNDLKFDPTVDKREVLLTGFQGGQHDHSLHSLSSGPDGKWYFSEGNCGGKFTDKSGKTFYMNGSYYGSPWNIPGGKKSDDGFLWTCGFGVRMNPDGTKAEIFGHGFRNSYEQSINSLGDIFQNDNDDVLSCRNSYVLEYGSAGFFTRDGTRMWTSERRPGQTLSWAHWRQDDPGTFDAGDIYGLGSPTGNLFYENGALGEKWVGTYLAGEAARNTIFGYKPKENGATFQMDRFDFLTTNLQQEFVGGDFTKRVGNLADVENKAVLFRPSDIAIGPDGALYVADWYDGRVGGHGTIDDTCSGAIYRVAPKGFKPSIPSMDLSTVAGQIEALKSPANNVRHLGFVRLKENKEKSLPAVLELLAHPNKYVAARAIWLLPYLGDQGLEKCVALLKSDNAEQRLVAYRALRRAEVNVLPYAQQLAADSNVAVRRDVALSLRHYSAEETLPIFVELVKRYDGKDKNYLEAIGLGAENKEDAIWLGLRKVFTDGDPLAWTENFTKLTWRLWNVSAIDDLKARASSDKLSQKARDFAVESLAFINDRKSADALLELAGSSPAIKDSTTYWLLKRGTGVWSHMGFGDALKERGIYDPETVVISPITVPEPSKESKLPPLEEVMKLTGDAQKGKATIMRCTMCHHIEGVGPDYGPSLKGWGATQSREAIIKSILTPSADIAHGFYGQEITLKDGKKLQGLVVDGDPLLVTSTGGITQMVPLSRVEKREHMNRSLMMSAEQLGLSAQDVADIASFMQQWK